MGDTKPISITGLVIIPAAVTLAVTILRLVGELQRWPKPWFSTAAGGGGALIGISWLPIIFGPYFAVKLINNRGPSSAGKAFGFAFLSVAIFFFAVWMFQSTFSHPSIVTLLAFPIMLIAALIPGIGWRTLGSTLLAYAFAARIPVLIVMFLAMRGNGGQGWGTHYDAIAPIFVHLSFARKYFYESFLPQMTMWIGWTVSVGAIFGTLAGAIVRLRRRAAQPAAQT